MSKISKIIVAVVVVVIFIALFAVVTGVRSDAGAATPGFLGIVLFAGMIVALRAVWKQGEKDE